MKSWYKVSNVATDPTAVDVYIVDFIGDWIDDYWGFGVTAKSFIELLSGIADDVKTINVHINSPGGDVFAALQIANVLRDQEKSKGRTVNVMVEGLAASAASIVMMAGSTITIADNALVMIHNPWSVAFGEAKDFRKSAEVLDKVKGTIIATYQWLSTLSAEVLGDMMDKESWLDADEAIAAGLATAKSESLKAAASFEPGSLAKLKVPAKFQDRIAALVKPEPKAPVLASASDILKACRIADCMEAAEDIVSAGLTMEAVQARVDGLKTAKAAKAARATEIRGICKTAGHEDLADGYVEGAMSPASVRAHLTSITAKIDAANEIDGTLVDGLVKKNKAPINIIDVYAERAKQAQG